MFRMWVVVFVALFCVSFNLQANIFDKFEEKVQQTVSQVKSRFAENDPAPAMVFDKDRYRAELSGLVPWHWQIQWVQEPVFSSEMLMVQVGSKSKPPILLVHGLGQNGFKDWLKVIPQLEKHFFVTAIDLPGFGYSQKPKGRYSPSNYSEILHWLKKHISSSPIYVVGHSMGGAISLRYGHNYPEDITRLILVDAAGVLHRTAFVKHVADYPISVPEQYKEVNSFIYKAKDFGGGLIEKLALLPDPVALLKESDLAWGALLSGAPGGNAALAMIEENFSEAVYRLPVQTHIIWGEDDRVAPVRTGLVLKHHLPHSKLSLMKGVGHVPMNSHPDLFNDLLLSALLSPWIKESKMAAPASVQKLPNLECSKQTNQVYSGQFNHINIEHCVAVSLKNVTANSVRVNHSSVSLESVTINSTKVALQTKESVIVATNSHFEGQVAVDSTGSRFDLAGVVLKGKSVAFRSSAQSRLVLSVSRVISPFYTGYAHGDFLVRKQDLDSQL